MVFASFFNLQQRNRLRFREQTVGYHEAAEGGMEGWLGVGMDTLYFSVSDNSQGTYK